MSEPLIDREEAKRRLGVGLGVLRELERRGELRAIRLGRRCVRYRPEDVERLRAQGAA